MTPDSFETQKEIALANNSSGPAVIIAALILGMSMLGAAFVMQSALDSSALKVARSPIFRAPSRTRLPPTHRTTAVPTNPESPRTGMEKALIAYNGGARRLANFVRAAGSYEAWRNERMRAGNSQLLGYASKVLDYRRRFVEEDLFQDHRAMIDASSVD